MAVLAALTRTYYSVPFSHLIDARLDGERERTLPRVYARPLVLWSGQVLSRQDLISRLTDLGYAQRDQADAPGEFSVERDAVAIKPRSSDLGDDVVRVSFGRGG